MKTPELKQVTPAGSPPSLSDSRLAIGTQIAGNVDAILKIENIEGHKAFLHEAADLVCQMNSARREGRIRPNENTISPEDVREFDGLLLSFMDSEIFKQLCAKYGFGVEDSESIMIQAERRTGPHIYMRGQSSFLPLNEVQGFFNTAGGIYMGPYVEGQTSFSLDYVEAVPGKLFHIPARTIHFFEPSQGGVFTAIAIVSPKIRKADGQCDIVRFADPLVTKGRKADIQLTI